jgi:trimeric autotransporter adhesin
MKKKSLIVLTVITLVFASLLTIGLTGRNSGSAIAAQVSLPNRAIVGLKTGNNLSVLRPGSTSFTDLGTVSVPNGDTLIGIDFRLQGGQLYGVGAKGSVYRIVNSNGLRAIRVSTPSPRFNAGFQTLVDFNPVANAIRLIGNNDQNIAVASANGRDLNTAAVQTRVAYIPGDPFSGTNPNLADGAYTNVIAGAKNTIFYMVDFGTDKLVTIAPPLTATLSSNTGGGRLQTIGSVLDSNGRAMSFSPTTSVDIVTAGGKNTMLILTNGTLATIDVSTIPPVLAAGVSQNVRASTVRLGNADNVMDMAVQTSN